MGIRRQIKINEDSISFAKLLKEICDTPEILSRDRFVALYKGMQLSILPISISINLLARLEVMLILI